MTLLWQPNKTDLTLFFPSKQRAYVLKILIFITDINLWLFLIFDLHTFTPPLPCRNKHAAADAYIQVQPGLILKNVNFPPSTQLLMTDAPLVPVCTVSYDKRTRIAFFFAFSVAVATIVRTTTTETFTITSVPTARHQLQQYIKSKTSLNFMNLQRIHTTSLYPKITLNTVLLNARSLLNKTFLIND